MLREADSNTRGWVGERWSLGALGITLLERYVGIWGAYLALVCIMGLGIMPLLFYRHKFSKQAKIADAIQWLDSTSKGQRYIVGKRYSAGFRRNVIEHKIWVSYGCGKTVGAI